MLRENEIRNKELKKCNFELEENLFLYIKQYRKSNQVSQRKLVSTLLKLGIKELLNTQNDF